MERKICSVNSNTPIREAKAIYLKDADGNQYFDCLAGAATLALGNNHPVVLDAIANDLKANLPLHTLDLSTPVKNEIVTAEQIDSISEIF
jgi:diaminobutyrate-2-oxoglutarate transaminase